MRWYEDVAVQRLLREHPEVPLFCQLLPWTEDLKHKPPPQLERYTLSEWMALYTGEESCGELLQCALFHAAAQEDVPATLYAVWGLEGLFEHSAEDPHLQMLYHSLQIFLLIHLLEEALQRALESKMPPWLTPAVKFAWQAWASDLESYICSLRSPLHKTLGTEVLHDLIHCSYALDWGELCAGKCKLCYDAAQGYVYWTRFNFSLQALRMCIQGKEPEILWNYMTEEGRAAWHLWQSELEGAPECPVPLHEGREEEVSLPLKPPVTLVSYCSK